MDPDGVLVFGYNPAPQGYDQEAASELWRGLLDEAAALPGVEAVGMASFVPIVTGDGMIERLALPEDGGEPVTTRRFDVSAGYFEAIGTRLLAGRGLTDEEQHQAVESGPGVVLSLAAARALFGDAEPVGRSVELRRRSDDHVRQVVIGVAEDVRGSGLRREGGPAVYLPLGGARTSVRHLLVRSPLSPRRTERMVRDLLAALDPAIPFFHTAPLSESVKGAMAEERLLARSGGDLEDRVDTPTGRGRGGSVEDSRPVRHRRSSLCGSRSRQFRGGEAASLRASAGLVLGIGRDPRRRPTPPSPELSAALSALAGRRAPGGGMSVHLGLYLRQEDMRPLAP